VLNSATNSLDVARHQSWANELSKPSLYTIPNTSPSLTWFDRTIDYICDEPSRLNSTCAWALTQVNSQCASATNPQPSTMLHLRAQNANASGFKTFVAAGIDDVQCHDSFFQSDLKVIGPVVDQMDVKDPNENRVHVLDGVTGQVEI